MKIKYKLCISISYIGISVFLLQRNLSYETLEFWGVLLAALAIQISTALSMLDDD